jgi:hypothetical protein
MRYVQSKDGVFIRHIIDSDPTLFDDDVYSFVRHLTDEQMSEFGISKLVFVTPPGFNPLTQTQEEGDAVLVEGKWLQNWIVTDLNQEEALDNIRKLRAAAYPSIGDQLDLIFHNGLDTWKEQILSIKTKYPKP